MIVSDVGRTTSGSSSSEAGSGITACAPAFPVALSRVCVTRATSLANPSTCSASFARKLMGIDRKSTRLNSSHGYISYAVFCLKKKTLTYEDAHSDKFDEAHLIRVKDATEY